MRTVIVLAILLGSLFPLSSHAAFSPPTFSDTGDSQHEKINARKQRLLKKIDSLVAIGIPLREVLRETKAGRKYRRTLKREELLRQPEEQSYGSNGKKKCENKIKSISPANGPTTGGTVVSVSGCFSSVRAALLNTSLQHE